MDWAVERLSGARNRLCSLTFANGLEREHETG